MTTRRANATDLARNRASKKAKITKEKDELDVSKSSDGAAIELFRAVELLIRRAEVIAEQQEPQESDLASHDRESELVANGVSVITRRRQPGKPITDLFSPDERMALTELLQNVETVIQEHDADRLTAESMAKLKFNITNLAIIDIEEGMDSTKVPDWVPEESIDQRLANLSLGNTRQSTVSEAELKFGRNIENKFNEPDKVIPDIMPPESNWESAREHLSSYPERRKRYVGKGGETEG